MAVITSLLALAFVLGTVYAGAVKKSGLRAALFKSDIGTPASPSSAVEGCARCSVLEEEIASLKQALAALRTPTTTTVTDRRSSTERTASGRWNLRGTVTRSDDSACGSETESRSAVGLVAEARAGTEEGPRSPRSPIVVQVVSIEGNKSD
jgi:hypothetical protein